MQDSQTAISGQRPAISRPARSFRLSTFRLRRSRSGFTLTELLIVIAIIAVLAGLIAAAAVNALENARRAAILLDIKNISAAAENFKNDYGSYPPNGMNPAPNAGAGTPSALVQSDFERMFKKAFPRHQEPRELILGLCGQGTGSVNLPEGMSPAEAMVFWLGGFSSDEVYPISGPGGPSFLASDSEVMENRNRRYEFDLGLLGPRNDNGAFNGRSIQYQIMLNGANQNRQINLWQFTPKGSEQPLVYFDTSRHKPVKYDLSYTPNGATQKVYALKKVREGFTGTRTKNDLVFIDPKFQILHSGLDDDWGGFGASTTDTGTSVDDVIIFPEGPFIGPLADTLTNFGDGELADESEQ